MIYTNAKRVWNERSVVRALEKCYNCNWEGKEEELVKEPGNLMFYDQLLMDQLNGAKVTRSNLLCPRCGTMIRSQRSIE
ncbi:MAG: hypothetical protein MIO90_07410 [Methanomassiliicoccales archaeon]|nr:hypothetical protein [Methanomassiliicoccales archaeon]